MGDILTIAKKMERALRLGTGFNATEEELLALVEGGIFERVHSLKVQELQAKCLGRKNTPSAIFGSTSEETGSRPTSGRSPATIPPLDRSSIAALANEI